MESVKKIVKSFLSILARHYPIFYTKLKYKLAYNYKVDFKNPKTIVDKYLYLEHYSDTSLWSICSDKYRVREYVKSKGWGSILNELYDVFEDPSLFDINKYPNSFVVKANNGCGSVAIVSDKTHLDIHALKKEMKKWLKDDYGNRSAQPHYSRIKPCIIVEKKLTSILEESLTDFKITCIHGNPIVINVLADRIFKNGKPTHKFKEVFYDPQWNLISSDGIDNDVIFPKPESLDLMLKIAKDLSADFPFVRVDLYEIDNKPVFGELTFTPGFDKEDLRLGLGDRLDISSFYKH